MFVPIGTTVIAPAAGTIYGTGSTLGPATGRWIGIDFDNGMRWRSLHHKSLIRFGGRVNAGEPIAISGASGYGHEDWSHLAGMPNAHTHVTLWPVGWQNYPLYGYHTVNGKSVPYTIDFMNFVSGTAGGGVTPPTPNPEETSENMDYLFQVDPAIDGRWVVANYRDRTLAVIPNGFQLDQLRAEKAMPGARPLYEYTGPQPVDRIAGLRVLPNA